MNRRAFFGLAAGAAALALDPERALWLPGRTLISIPRPRLQRFRVTSVVASSEGWDVVGFGWISAELGGLRPGDTFTIAGVNAINRPRR